MLIILTFTFYFLYLQAIHCPFQKYICMVPVSNDRMARLSQLFLLVRWPETVNNTLYHYSEAWSKTEVILCILTLIATMYNIYCAFFSLKEVFTIFGTKSLSQFPFFRCRSFTYSLRHREINKNVLCSLTTRDRTRNDR
jgi:hypothetical protein